MGIHIVEIFESIQGEGVYAGRPVLFIRTHGCNRECKFCDTKYSNKKDFKDMPTSKLASVIDDYEGDTVVFTGGEPLLQFASIKEVMNACLLPKLFHLETNGDFLIETKLNWFSFVTVSPKNRKVAELVESLRAWKSGYKKKLSIKVVTDLRLVGTKLLPYATMVMPLTTGRPVTDRRIRREVWEYCVEHRLRYSPRLHAEVWGWKKRRK